MKQRSNSVPRDLQLPENPASVSSRCHLLPGPMFHGHKAEFRSLLPHRKATLRLRAPRPPHWHYHIEKQYEDLYEPSPTRKKAKLRAARLKLPGTKAVNSEKNLLFVTEMEHGSSSRSLQPRSYSSRVSSRCGDLITRAEALLNAEKENTSRILNGYRRIQGGKIAGNRELRQICAGHQNHSGKRRRMLL